MYNVINYSRPKKLDNFKICNNNSIIFHSILYYYICISYSIIYYIKLMSYFIRVVVVVVYCNYLCNQCLSGLKLRAKIPIMAGCTRYNIM